MSNREKNLETMDYEQLNEVLANYREKPGSLITVLQRAQELYGYLPIPLLEYIAAGLHLKPAAVLGVATFYTQFRMEPIGKHLIMLCQGTACHVNSSQKIEETICETLNIQEGETTEDGLFTLKNVACLGCCSLAPAMLVNGETYGNLTPKKVKEILAGIQKQEAEGASI